MTFELFLIYSEEWHIQYFIIVLYDKNEYLQFLWKGL